jgi:ABC-type ATPase with predicted acetyltransferase domain
MTTFSVDTKFGWQGRITPKVENVCRMFGLDVDRLAEASPRHKCTIELNAGQIAYITGPSGSGKSVLLREMAAAHAEGIDLDSIDLSGDRAVIDSIDGNFVDTLRTLSIAGLSDVFAVLNKPAYLSEGQKYRFRLAKALSLIGAGGMARSERSERGHVSCEPRATSHERRIIFADEFCSNLDRITASVIAFQIRKFATRHNVAFVLASSHQDILADLQPDVIVMKKLNSKTEVIYKYVHANKKS